jgi:hypothetical protein
MSRVGRTSTLQDKTSESNKAKLAVVRSSESGTVSDQLRS